MVLRYWLPAILLLTFHAYGFSCPAVSSEVSTPATMATGEEPSYNGKTSLKRFPINLAKNFEGLFSRENVAPLWIGLSAAGISSTFDEDVHDYFDGIPSQQAAEDVGATLGKPYVVVPAITGLLIGGHYSKNQKFKSFSYALSQALVIDYVLVQSVKYATERERPDGSNSQSFPSGHATDSFMIATVIHEYYGKKAGIIAYGAASFITASRITSDVHWLSDVVAGATIGFIVGRTVSHYTGGTMHDSRFAIIPTVDPINKSYGVTFTARLP